MKKVQTLPAGFELIVYKLSKMGVRHSRPAPWSAERRAVRPPRSGLRSNSAKKDRSGTCPLKHRGETQFRRKFFCLLFSQEKEGTRRPRAGSGS